MPDLTTSEGQPASSLPTMSKRETLKRYRMRVEGVQRWREDEGYDKTWSRLRDMYRLRMFSAFAEEDQILVAVAFATVNVIEPSVAINHPSISVWANTEEETDQSVIAEAVVNYWWRHFDIQPEFRSAVKDFLVYGHGWLKVFWRYTEVQTEIPDEEFQSNVQAAVSQADQFATAYPHLAADLPTNEDIINGLPTSRSVVAEDRPVVERVSPYDMFVDPDATSDRDWGWICQRVVRPIEEARSDARYKQSVRRRLEADGSVDWHLEKSKYNVKNEGENVTLWEFYDLRRMTVSVFAEQGDDFLVDPQPMPYSYGLPYVMLRDYDVPDQFYPIGELEALEPLQNELNETRSSMVRARKLDLRKWMVRKNFLTSANVTALQSDQDGQALVVDGDTPFADVMAPVPVPQARPELYNHSETILNDLNRVSGISEYQRGELPEIRRTATEASIIQDAANARAADKLDQVQAGVTQVARRLLMLAQQYLTGEQAARITGTNGQTLWFKYKREDITGEFDFMVESGSMRPKNETFRRQQANELMQAMAPLIQAGVIDPRAVAEKVLRDGFDIKDPSKFIIPPPPPDQQEKPPIKLIETMAYKDTPPDIQRQIEALAGFTPSVIGTLDERQAAFDNVATAQDHARAQLEGQVGLQQTQQQIDNAKQAAKNKPKAK